MPYSICPADAVAGRGWSPFATVEVCARLSTSTRENPFVAEQKHTTELTSEEIRRKADEWLSKGGKEQLIQAFEKSKMDSRTLRSEAQVDLKILNEPVTV